MIYKGKYKPQNPQKYCGDSNNITYRSGLEFRFMRYLDINQHIIRWASEELPIPYKSPVDNRQHRYFPDFIIQKLVNGILETIVIEVKPSCQTVVPKNKGTTVRHKKRFIQEAITWGVNEAKWDAAIKYCQSKGWQFKIITEKEIGT